MYIFIAVIFFVAGIMFEYFYMKRITNSLNKKNSNSHKIAMKNLDLFLIMIIWMEKIQDGKSISGYLKNNNIQTVAIYGMAYLGTCLERELDRAGIDVLYVMDRNTSICSDRPILSLNDELPKVDLIIVTPIIDFEKIKLALLKKIDTSIVSMKDIVLVL
jgi:hypothetical protein